jgi:hypothetical protein
MAGAFESQTETVRATWWEEDESATIRRWDMGQCDRVNQGLAAIADQQLATPRQHLQKLALLLLREGLVSLNRANPNLDDLHFIIQKIRKLNLKEG